MLGIMHRLEQGDQAPAYSRSAAKGFDDGDQAVGEAALAQIAEPGAEQDHVGGLERGGNEQLVERVILGLALEHLGDRPLDRSGAGQHAFGVSRAHLEHELVDIAEPAFVERRGEFLEHPEAEILEHRHRFRQAGSGRPADRS